MHSQRLLSCLLMLQGERRQTARQLADALNVSIRTVYRDVDALSSAGVPIYMERGPRGGIVLADDYRRALAQFTGDELQALFALGSEPMADLGVTSLRAALAKLAGALPVSQRAAAERGRGRLLLDHNRWYRGEQPTDMLGQLRAAIMDERRMQLRYRDRKGEITQRTVDPLGLVAKAGVWYLVAHETAKGYRSFRAQRIVDAVRLDERFARDPGFDLDSYWKSSVASLESRSIDPYRVTLRVAASAVDRIKTMWQTTVLEEGPDSAIVRTLFPNQESAAAHVLAYGEQVDLIDPPELREALLAAARATLAKYENLTHA